MKNFSEIIPAILKRFGSDRIKAAIWNREFYGGRWDYLTASAVSKSRSGNRDIIYYYIEKYCKQGSILDLGCGTGNTSLEVAENKYCYYMGVDISNIAIQQALSACKADSIRSSKNNYIAEDISKYAPDRRYNVILFRESLYYINKFIIKKVLDRYINYLKENGVMLVRICDRKRFNSIIKLINNNYDVIEKYVPENNKAIVIVFKPNPSL